MKIPPGVSLAIALALVAGGRCASGQTALYVANSTPATPETGAVHFLQMVSASPNQGPGVYNINSFTISFNFTATDDQSIRLTFYSGVDTSPNSASALASATVIQALTGDVPPPSVGNYAFTFSYATPFSLHFSDANAVGVEIILTNAATGAYTTTTNGRFTPSTPTTGAADGYVWNDANFDNVFTGAEQTRFGMANANIRMAFTGTLARPTPSIKAITRSGTTSTLTVDSYTGVTYQLQRATSLTAADWTNVGTSSAGATGTALTFTDNDTTDRAAFYRVVAALATAGNAQGVSSAQEVSPGPVAARRTPGGVQAMSPARIVRDP